MVKNHRTIFHVDLDAFFASSEERENPHFKGKPIVVGANPLNGKGRGVVSTANYKARKYGIHSAMPISKAWRLCPKAIFLPVNSSLYERISYAVMKILANVSEKYNGKFEQAGIDEAYIDLSNANNFHNHTYYPREIAEEIKTAIREREKIIASVGVGPNMLIAKIASDFQKPDGLTIVSPQKTQAFLDPLDIRKIPGIGPKTEIIFRKLKINTVFDLRQLDQPYLYDLLGEHGISLYESARGKDKREIAKFHETKSVSNDYTFPNDTDDLSIILPEFFPIVRRVIALFESQGFRNFKTITVRVRFSDFKTHTKSKSAGYSVTDIETIERDALRLLWHFVPHSKIIGKTPSRRKKIRLIGFRISNFS